MNINRAAAFILAVDQVVKDDIVSMEEADAVRSIWDGIEKSAEVVRDTEDSWNKLVVAAINSDGPLPIDSTLLGLSPGETPLFEYVADHLQQETYARGNSQGISIGLGNGIRLHTSTFMAQPRVDPEWTAVDRGPLTATTERVIFRGDTSTKEIPLRWIVGLRLNPDAIGIQTSYGIEIFQCEKAPVLAATINWLLNNGYPR